MITSDPKNKKITVQSDYRRSFLEELGPGDFVSSDPQEPVFLGSCDPVFENIRENILKINKTQIEPFFEPENRSCITAIVPCNISGDNFHIFDRFGHVFGCGKTPTTETCGKVRAKVICSEEYTHDYYYKHERCNNPDCPTCYSKFAHKLAGRVVQRVRGYMSVYPEDTVSHVVVWPQVTTGYRTMMEAFADARRMLARMGSRMSTVWYHPYRIRDKIKEGLRRYRRANHLDAGVGFWQMAHDDVLNLGGLDAYAVYGPHFHALSTGYLMNVSDYSKLGLGGYKKVRNVSSGYDLERLAYYLSTHTCWELKHQAVRYYGKISTSKLAKGYPRETIEDVVCKVCGKRMVEYYCDDADVLSGIVHDPVTKKVISYLYWKRGMKPKVPVYQEFQAVLPIGLGISGAADTSTSCVDVSTACVDADVIPRCNSCGRLMHKIERYEHGYTYRYACANTECESTADIVWYDRCHRVTSSSYH
jgi:hypothetical protein